ncbi:MAG TPA: hypothetical protein VHE30_14040 [Polyangiaceae bacterium]|nr:hypothetical protein [Polyangiaceae bacterium]
MKLSVLRVIVAAALATVACAEGSELAMDRASREFDCPRSKLRVRWLSYSKTGYVYRAEGCGVVATYDCDESDETCVKEGNDRPEPE